MAPYLPTWFLVFALFVPRISLFVGWIAGWAFGIPQPLSGIAWVFLPRVLVALTIFTAMGLCPWFWVHVGAALLIYLVSILKPYIQFQN